MLKYIDNNLQGCIDISGIEVEIKQFPAKRQWKVFIRFYTDLAAAKRLFRTLYRSKDIPIFDFYGKVKFYRKVKAYVVKEEALLE
jgi:hypothetical protein